ncbi:NADAR family protein [Streptomyces sp. NPDC049597]|uniref:NADAR family protein n=1 Tax=Streptomyces sp. NPDC049597 TaxID=3155276 RepID=UPI0034330A72
MIGRRVTHRTADGVRVPGTWRHAFIRNGDYYLTDLFIYADGLIDCWGLVTLDEFEQKLRSGWVATELPEGARASGHDLAGWTFHEPCTRLTPELLLAEIRDTIEQLNGRPDSTDRCLATVAAFLADRTEERRAAVRAAYHAIPSTQRIYALGDMDRRDEPLKILVAGPGGYTEEWPDDPVTQDEYDEAIAFLEDRARWIAERPTRALADGPTDPHAPAVHVPQVYPLKPSAARTTLSLRTDFPAPVDIDGVTYPSVAYAYWALSTADADGRAAIVSAATAGAAARLAAEAPRRDGWEQARTAVMTRLLRAKYAQHPVLAEFLLSTDDATLVYADWDSAYWGDKDGRGRNWLGRLLELVRSELHAERAGLG